MRAEPSSLRGKIREFGSKNMQDNRSKILLFTFFIFYFLFLVLAPALAQPELGIEYGKQTGLTQVDPRMAIARIINIVLGLLGMIAVIIILMGGFAWMTAGGNEEKVGKAKKLLTAGIIGLAIILGAYTIAYFVIQQLVTEVFTR